MSNYYGSRSSFRGRKQVEDVDPMTSMSGIGDVMLVFACGLMTALVVAWSIDLGSVAEVDLGQEIEDVEEMQEEIESGGGNYKEMGIVYQDPETGRYYLVQEQDSTGDDYDFDEGMYDESVDAGDIFDGANPTGIDSENDVQDSSEGA